MLKNEKLKRNPGLLVILCGLVTTIIALIIVFFLAGTEFNIIGWFGAIIIPAGAILMGIGSGSGYYLGSKITNSKISGVFMWLVFFIGVGGFIASHYLTYLGLIDTTTHSFLDYIKFEAENMSFSKAVDHRGEPLGIWGYAFLLLEGLGFSFGAMVPTLLLSGAPYCDQCQYYMKTQGRRHISSSLLTADLKSQKKPEKEAALVEAIETVTEAARQLVDSTAEANYENTRSSLQQLKEKPTKKALATATIELLKCPTCASHHLKGSLINQTTSGQLNNEDLFALERGPQNPTQPV